MVQNAVVQALRQADELKQKVLSNNDGAIPIPDRTLLLTQLQKAYQKILLMDLDYALDKKVEQDLWNVGFKVQIELLQNGTKDKKNPRRMESQTMLSWVLQAATGFYICLLHQICTAFKLNLPFRVSIPVPGAPPLSGGAPQAASCWYVCQHCLVHLGDLARYSRQPRRADSFYRQALSVSPRNGQPYNQLGLLRAARGDKLGAAYYHARGLAVGGPFPPAANNLARTLATHSAPPAEAIRPARILSSLELPIRLDPRTHTATYMAVHHSLQSISHLPGARAMVAGLSSTLTALVATDEFHSDTLIKMCCLDLYAIYSITDGHKLPSTALTQDESTVLSLGMELVAGTLAAFLLPAHTREPLDMLPYAALPAIKVLLEWIRLHPEALKSQSFESRPQLWPGLCTLLNSLQECIKDFTGEEYETIPLPEDEELQGYLPIDKAFSKLKYSNCASSPLFSAGNFDSLVLPSSGRFEKNPEGISNRELWAKMRANRFPSVEIENLKKDSHFLDCLRAYRLIEIGVWLASYQKENGTEYIDISMKDEIRVFTPIQNTLESNPELLKTIEELSLLREKRLSGELTLCNLNKTDDDDNLSDSETKSLKGVSVMSSSDTISGKQDAIPPPVIISEADFREKVIEKRAGILKPQGSLERARGEKMLSRAARIEVVSPDCAAGIAELLPDNTASQDAGSGSSTVSQEGGACSDVSSLLAPGRREGRKPRTNVAMQAIMRKQEESSKQVKFLTPVTTPEPMSDRNVSPLNNKDHYDKKKIIQPKVIKSLASLPTDRKTGGILSLKDKSAGYPHLVNTEPAPAESNKPENAEPAVSTEEVASKAAAPAIKAQEKSEQKPAPSGQYPDGKMHPSPTKNPPAKVYDNNPGKHPSEASVHRAVYTPWSDGTPASRPLFQNDPAMNQPDSKFGANLKYSAQNQQNQSKSMYFSYFSSPDSQSAGITLPVVNPKEIDIRSLALQKQKNSQLGMGDGSQMADQYINKMPQYNYWDGQPNVSRDPSARSNLPPRLANLYKNKSMEYPGRIPEQPGGVYRYAGYPYERNPATPNPGNPPPHGPGGWNTGVPPQPPNNWWKNRPDGPDISYDSYHNIAGADLQNYSQNYYPSSAEYPEQKAPLSYSRNMVNPGMQNPPPNLQQSSRYTNPNMNMPPAPNATYQNPPKYFNMPSNPYNKQGFNNQSSYSASMYPQFNNKFSIPSSQQLPKPQMANDFGMNPYASRSSDYNLIQNSNAMSMGEVVPDNMFMDSGMLGNQYGKDLHHPLQDAGNACQPNIPEFVPKKVGMEPVMNFEAAGGSPSGSGMSGGVKENPYMQFSEPVVSGGANTYSLFSGGPEAWVPNVPTSTNPGQQSLWPAAGPSLLERLLEQQKQLKNPAAE